jgi:outer membrane protein insertion porin family
LSAGLIEGWNDDNIRVNNRFYKGGNSFRGFDIAGLGPREVVYRSVLGQIDNVVTAPTDGVVSRPLFALDDGNGGFTQITASDTRFANNLEFAATDTDGSIIEAADGAPRNFQTAATDAEGNVIRELDGKGNALGGKTYAIGSLEMSFPVPFAPEEMGIGGALFTEFGILGELDEVDILRFNDQNSALDLNFDRANTVENDLSLRASVGVSVFWDSPFGPIRFDFSELLASEEYDRTESFRFSTRTQF